jgi:antitoxin CptB
MAWALGTQIIPDEYAGPMMEAMRKLDYVDIPR